MMKVQIPEERAPTAFYDQARNQAEAERLERMAQYADDVSIEAIGNITDRPHAICVDVGAGDSTSLGQSLISRNFLVHYLPVDQRQEAVKKHREAGFMANLGYATDLPFEDGIADVLHARFTFGWLDDTSRERAFEELLRVGGDRAKLAVIDYDWGVAHGPEPVNRLIDKVTGIMRQYGFDPNYGAKSAKEMEQNLAKWGYDTKAVTIHSHKTIIEEPMHSALSIIETTVKPVIGKLQEAGLSEEAAELQNLLDETQYHAEQYPQEVMRFPDIIAVTTELSNEQLHDENLAKIHKARNMARESLRGEAMITVGPAAMDTYRLPSSMILQARQIHAESFRNYRHVTDEGIRAEDNTLIEEIDPQSIVDRSTYIGTVNDEGKVMGTIRVIHPENGDKTTLPTIAKVKDALGEDSELWQSLTSPDSLLEHSEEFSLPFMRPNVEVVEASALGKSSQAKDPQVMPKLILAAMCDSLDQGAEYIVMSMVESTSRLIVGAFGKKAFKRIDGDAAIVTLKGKGIKEGGVKLVPFYVHLPSFIDNCLAHFDRYPDNPSMQANKNLFEQARPFVRSAA